MISTPIRDPDLPRSAEQSEMHDSAPPVSRRPIINRKSSIISEPSKQVSLHFGFEVILEFLAQRLLFAPQRGK